MEPEARKRQIIAKGLVLAEQHSIKSVTLPMLAREIGVTHPLLVYHCGRINEIRRKIAELAISEGCAKVIMQAVSCDIIAMSDVPANVRKAVFK